MKAFIHAELFTGTSAISGKVLLADEDRIIDVTERNIPETADIIDLQGGYLVPAFIDIQLYGGNGHLFAEYPSVEAIQATYAYSLAGGATHILPTIATTSYDKIFQAIEAVREYQSAGYPGVPGLHIEGPFINPAKKGAHIEAFIKRPVLADVEELIRRGKGIIKMMTLAPEVCSEEVIRYLRENDVIVSAGHSNATYEEAMDAFNKGISAATHLYNAMSGLQHRAPGMVGAIFNADTVNASVVADGHHVDFAAIRIAKKLMKERLFLITDAVTENNTGYYQHHLQGDKYIVPDGTLSGSCLTMLKAVKNCIEQIGIPMEEAFRMASLYPAQVIGLDKKLGRLESGYQAEFLWLSNTLELKGVFTNRKLTVF